MAGAIGKTFLYFAYDTNMLSNRMECCVGKSVRRAGLGKLEDYTIKFGSFSPVWYGTLPTLVKECGCIVWGSLWQVEECLKPKLDTLMGAGSNIYIPKTIPLSSLKSKGGKFEAMTYVLANAPEPYELNSEGKWKLKFRPSRLYYEELIDGAEETCLPLYYRKWLRKIPNNGYTGSVRPNLKVDI